MYGKDRINDYYKLQIPYITFIIVSFLQIRCRHVVPLSLNTYQWIFPNRADSHIFSVSTNLKKKHTKLENIFNRIIMILKYIRAYGMPTSVLKKKSAVLQGYI